MDVSNGNLRMSCSSFIHDCHWGIFHPWFDDCHLSWRVLFHSDDHGLWSPELSTGKLLPQLPQNLMRRRVAGDNYLMPIEVAHNILHAPDMAEMLLNPLDNLHSIVAL